MAISTRPDAPGDGYDGGRSPWDGQRMSLEAFLALPEQKPALEYLEGIAWQKMAPTPDHSEVEAVLYTALNEAANPQQLGRAFLEVRFVQDGAAYVPDVGYYRRSRLRLRPGRRYERDLGPPDVAIEVVSPEQPLGRLTQKCLNYLRLGTAVALVVDPDDEAVVAFRMGQPPQVWRGADRINLGEVLPGFVLTVEQLFRAIVPDWLDEPPEIETEMQARSAQAGEAAQTEDAAASERSDG